RRAGPGRRASMERRPRRRRSRSRTSRADRHRGLRDPRRQLRRDLARARRARGGCPRAPVQRPLLWRLVGGHAREALMSPTGLRAVAILGGLIAVAALFELRDAAHVPTQAIVELRSRTWSEIHYGSPFRLALDAEIARALGRLQLSFAALAAGLGML